MGFALSVWLLLVRDALRLLEGEGRALVHVTGTIHVKVVALQHSLATSQSPAMRLNVAGAGLFDLSRVRARGRVLTPRTTAARTTDADAEPPTAVCVDCVVLMEAHTAAVLFMGPTRGGQFLNWLASSNVRLALIALRALPTAVYVGVVLPGIAPAKASIMCVLATFNAN